jgi:antirestriction protein
MLENMNEELEEVLVKVSEEHSIPVEVCRMYFDNHHNYDLEELAKQIHWDNYGQWESEEDFAEDTMNSFVDVQNEWWGSYIDYKKMARDLFMGDYYSFPFMGGIWVFRNS